MHQYGIVLWLASVVRVDPQCPQHRSSGQTTPSNHFTAASSLGNISARSSRLIPFRWLFPGPFAIFPISCQGGHFLPFQVNRISAPRQLKGIIPYP